MLFVVILFSEDIVPVSAQMGIHLFGILGAEAMDELVIREIRVENSKLLFDVRFIGYGQSILLNKIIIIRTPPKYR
jgi:hypothetical protein